MSSRAALLGLLALSACRSATIDEAPADSAVSAPDVADAMDAALDAPAPDARVETDAGPAVFVRDPGRVRVATFNVHRYFDTVCDSHRCSADDFEAVLSPSEFVEKTDALARAIEALDVDAVLLEEVEDVVCLNALRDRLGGAFPVAVLGETGSPGSVDVGVLARDPVLEVRTHRAQAIVRPDGSRTLFSREFLEVHVDHDGRRVVLFAAHFRSMVDDDPGRREAEGGAAHDIVERTAQEFPEALVVMGGDLNDVPGSATLNALTNDGALERVAAELPAGADATYRYFGRYSALDHLLRATSGGGRYLPGTVSVRRDPQGTNPLGGYGGSDHATLRAEFAVP